MSQPPQKDLYARKNEGFSYQVVLVGYDYTGQTFTSHFRAYKDASSLIGTLTVVLASVQTITYQQSLDLHYRTEIPAGKLPTDTEAVSTLSLTVLKSNMASIPISPLQNGAPQIYVYDVQIDGGETPVILEGKFIVDGGVTKP